jgi:hypothetical protein
MHFQPSAGLETFAVSHLVRSRSRPIQGPDLVLNKLLAFLFPMTSVRLIRGRLHCETACVSPIEPTSPAARWPQICARYGYLKTRVLALEALGIANSPLWLHYIDLGSASSTPSPLSMPRS